MNELLSETVKRSLSLNDETAVSLLVTDVIRTQQKQRLARKESTAKGSATKEKASLDGLRECHLPGMHIYIPLEQSAQLTYLGIHSGCCRY
jgi:hypothetical protein